MALPQLSKWSMCGTAVLLIILIHTVMVVQNDTGRRYPPLQLMSTVQQKWRGDNLLDIRNSTLGFEKIFVINMPDRVDKRDIWAMAGFHSNISFEFSDGVVGDSLPAKAIPAGWNTAVEDGKTLGCFRGHMDVIQKMVKERISSVMIFEDDSDWDVTIKSQLVEFARGARYMQNSGDVGLNSPYGDDWDLFWFGHCGAGNHEERDDKYYVIHDDPTVPDIKHRTSKRAPNLSPAALSGNYTRIVYEPTSGLCSTAYALSLKGAEKLLYHFSLEPDAPVWDRALRKFCFNRLSGGLCLSVWPALVESYMAPGNTSRDSDRTARPGAYFRQKGQTWNLVFPMRPNFEHFVTRNFTIPSQWGEESMWPTIDPRTWESPRGHGEYVLKTEFKKQT